MRIALLGLPGSGKKTFFSLLTECAGAGPATLHCLLKRSGVRREGEALVGNAPIRDERLESLARIVGREKVVFAENTIVLCPDVAPGSGVEKWLETARRCDLLCILLRAFEAGSGYQDAGSADAVRDKPAMESELVIADLELIENRLNRLAKEKRGARASSQDLEQHVLEKIGDELEKQTGLFPMPLEDLDIEPVKSLGLLALKPALWAYNVDENRLAGAPDTEEEKFRVSCKIEQEIMELESREEQAVYLRDSGLERSGIDRLNNAAYDALGLMSFYTVGKDEVRAWTVRKGATAPEAAGKVHSDIERGFIRAEIIKHKDLVEAGGEAAAKAAGKMHVKGKDYVIEDGDICRFRFNV